MPVRYRSLGRASLQSRSPALCQIPVSVRPPSCGRRQPRIAGRRPRNPARALVHPRPRTRIRRGLRICIHHRLRTCTHHGHRTGAHHRTRPHIRHRSHRSPVRHQNRARHRRRGRHHGRCPLQSRFRGPCRGRFRAGVRAAGTGAADSWSPTDHRKNDRAPLFTAPELTLAWGDLCTRGSSEHRAERALTSVFAMFHVEHHCARVMFPMKRRQTEIAASTAEPVTG